MFANYVSKNTKTDGEKVIIFTTLLWVGKIVKRCPLFGSSVVGQSVIILFFICCLF